VTFFELLKALWCSGGGSRRAHNC